MSSFLHHRSHVHDPSNTQQCIRQCILYSSSAECCSWSYGRLHRFYSWTCQWQTILHTISGIYYPSSIAFSRQSVNFRSYDLLQRIIEKQNKVIITDRMWARLLSSTNQPSFIYTKDEMEEDEEHGLHRMSSENDYCSVICRAGSLPSNQKKKKPGLFKKLSINK